MGLFSKQPAVTLVPTDMTEAWFDKLIATTPSEAGLKASSGDLEYIRDHLMVITIDDCLVGILKASRVHAALRQYEDLMASTNSLEQRMSFAKGFKPNGMDDMRARILRQRKQMIDAAAERGWFVDPSKPHSLEALRALVAEMRRTRPY